MPAGNGIHAQVVHTDTVTSDHGGQGQPVIQPDTGWQADDPGGQQSAKAQRAKYEPTSNGAFASLLRFSQMAYDLDYVNCSDELAVRGSSE